MKIKLSKKMAIITLCLATLGMGLSPVAAQDYSGLKVEANGTLTVGLRNSVIDALTQLRNEIIGLNLRLTNLEEKMNNLSFGGNEGNEGVNPETSQVWSTKTNMDIRFGYNCGSSPNCPSEYTSFGNYNGSSDSCGFLQHRRSRVCYKNGKGAYVNVGSTCIVGTPKVSSIKPTAAVILYTQGTLDKNGNCIGSVQKMETLNGAASIYRTIS